MGILRELVLELADHCPLKCLHCSSDSGPARSRCLTPEVSLSLVDQAHALGAEQVSFGGGEPVCSSLLEPVLQKVSAAGMRADLFTCGVVCDEAWISPWPRSFADRLSRHANLKVIFSAHGHTPEAHDAITRVPGSFSAMLHSLDLCVAAGLCIEINFVPLRPNIAYFPGLVELAENRGVGRISVLRFVPQGRGEVHRAPLQLSNKEEDAFVQQLLLLRSRTAVDIRTGSPFNGIVAGNNVPCRAGHEKLVVQADGNVLPCEVFKSSETKDWGLSVYDSDLRTILKAPTLRRLRARVSACDAHACPVHTHLRALGSREAPDVRQQVPEAAVHV